MKDPKAILRFDDGTRAALWADLGKAIDTYLGGVSRQRVIPAMDPHPVREFLAGFDFDRPEDSRSVLAKVVEGMTRFQLHPAHPLYFGLFNPSPATMAIVADALVATVNPQLAAWSHSPFGVEVERRLIEEICGKFGFPAGNRDGTFASGGAEANHTAVLTAMANRFPGCMSEGVGSIEQRAVIYVSTESHDSLEKAAGMSGLGRKAVCRIPAEDDLRMNLGLLSRRIAEDRSSGKIPLMVVGTAGTTSAGVIDPLEGLSAVAREEGAWFHVDAAWGGAAVFEPGLRAALNGIETADSITFDAHKWLSMPMGAGLYLNRHPGLLESTFRLHTGYMPREAEGLGIVDPFAVSMQWSRRMIGLKLFMTLAVAGWEGYATVIREQAARGRELRDLLERDGWVIVNQTPLPVVCFDLGEGPTTEHFTRLTRIVFDIVGSGRAWVSTVRLRDGRAVAIRACITNFETTSGDLHTLVGLLRDARRRVVSTEGGRR